MKEVSDMEDFRTTGQKYNLYCFRCGCIIKTGEKVVNLSVTVETPTQDDVLEVIEATAISTLCPSCASILLSQAIARDPSLMMPPAQDLVEEVKKDEDGGEISVGDDEENEVPARLTVQSSSKGLRLVLNCRDGISKAASQFFTWRQIAQMLIAADPNMFGIPNESLHRVFLEALERFGLHVPGWRDLHNGNNLN
jgi:hypothetical protein